MPRRAAADGRRREGGGARRAAGRPGPNGVTPFARPRVVVSACLGFEACRYNGAIIPDTFLGRLAAHADLVQVCPEVEIGLGIPRDPIRIVAVNGVERLVQPAAGRDLTAPMARFAKTFLGGLRNVDGFVLKGRSPSCGVRDARIQAPGERGTTLGRGPGQFARAVLERFPDVAVEDEGRLTHLRIREHFLSRVFAAAAFRALARRPSSARLVDFHARHKLLLMAVSQRGLGTLGRIVANHERRAAPEVLVRYRAVFAEALARPPRPRAHVNVLMHALGYFKKGLASREKTHFLDALETYRRGRAPLAAPVAIVRSWIERFDEPYLKSQAYFRPFPEALLDLADSCRGREFRS